MSNSTRNVQDQLFNSHSKVRESQPRDPDLWAPQLPFSTLGSSQAHGQGREARRVSCPCNIHLPENHSQALVISPAGNVLSQSLGKVTLRSALPSHCASLQWEWSGHLIHSQNTVSAKANKSLTTAVQGRTKPGSVREASVRRNSGVLEGCWLHTVGLREWETRGNQTPPGSTQVSREDKLHTKVSRRQTGLRVSREKRSGGSRLREEPRGRVAGCWTPEEEHWLPAGGLPYQLGLSDKGPCLAEVS